MSLSSLSINECCWNVMISSLKVYTKGLYRPAQYCSISYEHGTDHKHISINVPMQLSRSCAWHAAWQSSMVLKPQPLPQWPSWWVIQLTLNPLVFFCLLHSMVMDLHNHTIALTALAVEWSNQCSQRLSTKLVISGAVLLSDSALQWDTFSDVRNTLGIMAAPLFVLHTRGS